MSKHPGISMRIVRARGWCDRYAFDREIAGLRAERQVSAWRELERKGADEAEVRRRMAITARGKRMRVSLAKVDFRHGEEGGKE
jgi:hypothetical protein